MHFVSLVVSLLSVGALTFTHAVPVGEDYLTLERRNPITVGGHQVLKGHQISPNEHGKSTVWNVANIDGHWNPGHVVKQYHQGGLSAHEVAGLQAVGQHVAHDYGTNHVVMKHVPGQTLAQLAGGIKDHKQRQAFVNAWKPHVAAKAAAYAHYRGVLHGDLNMNNVVVNHGNVDFVDWEHYHTPGSPHFTTDARKIHADLDTVWDSTGTPRH